MRFSFILFIADNQINDDPNRNNFSPIVLLHWCCQAPKWRRKSSQQNATWDITQTRPCAAQVTMPMISWNIRYITIDEYYSKSIFSQLTTSFIPFNQLADSALHRVIGDSSGRVSESTRLWSNTQHMLQLICFIRLFPGCTQTIQLATWTLLRPQHWAHHSVNRSKLNSVRMKFDWLRLQLYFPLTHCNLIQLMCYT